MRPEDPISAAIDDRDGVAVLAVKGEIDMASAAAFKSAISEALANDPTALVIDLQKVAFLGSAGVSVLIEAQDKFGRDDRFAVVASGALTSRIQLLDLGELISVHDSVDKALSAVGAG